MSTAPWLNSLHKPVAASFMLNPGLRSVKTDLPQTDNFQWFSFFLQTILPIDTVNVLAPKLPLFVLFDTFNILICESAVIVPQLQLGTIKRPIAAARRGEAFMEPPGAQLHKSPGWWKRRCPPTGELLLRGSYRPPSLSSKLFGFWRTHPHTHTLPLAHIKKNPSHITSLLLHNFPVVCKSRLPHSEAGGARWGRHQDGSRSNPGLTLSYKKHCGCF